LDLFTSGVIKKLTSTQIAISDALAPLYERTDTWTQKQITHMPLYKRLELTRFTFHLPQTKSMKRVSYRRLSDTWRQDHVLKPCCMLIQTFCGLTTPTTKFHIFQRSLKVNYTKMLEENPWKELTPNEQSELFPHVDQPLVNRCFLSTCLAVASRDDSCSYAS